MRELPEPEVTDEIAEAQGFLTMWKSVTVKPMTTREVDFAKLVRRQAYEDGLAAAWQKVTDSFPKSEEFAGLRNGMILATNLIADMLTDSQKEAP